jgi:hypothetical protein
MTLATLARTHPRVIDWGIQLDRAPAAGWLALQAGALAPHWIWMFRRMRDGSDDPLGLLALAGLAFLAWTWRRELRPAPRLGWLATAMLGTLAATVLRTGAGPLPSLPPLAAGLVAVLALCCGLLAFLPRRVAALPIVSIPLFERWFANSFVNRIAHKSAFALVMLLCVVWSAATALHRPPELVAIARMTDDRQILVMRRVDTPTRMLHPAADCYRALGYGIAQARLERDVHTRLWRCFVAERAGVQKLRVCERIVDAEGAAFTDTSAWYWAAASGRSNGPWQAVTLARPIE